MKEIFEEPMSRKDRELDRTVAKMEAIIRENEGVDEPRAVQLYGAALSKLGHIRSDQGRYEEAARLHGEAASVWWQAEPLKGLALLQWIMQAFSLFRIARFDEALDAFEHVIALDGEFPNFVQMPEILPTGLNAWLAAVEETGDYDRLLRAAETAIERIEAFDTSKKPEVLARALNAKGTAERALGHADAALAAFDEAIDQCSVEALVRSEPLSRAMLRRAALLDESGDVQAASATYVDLLNRFASVPDAWAQEAVAEAKEWLSAEPR